MGKSLKIGRQNENVVYNPVAAKEWNCSKFSPLFHIHFAPILTQKSLFRIWFRWFFFSIRFSLSQCTFASFSLSFKTCNIIRNTHTQKLFSCYNLNKWEKSLSSVRFFISFRCAERLVNAKKETDRYPYTREERKQNAVSEWMRLHFINERSEKWIERKWKKKREIAAPSFKWNEIFLFDNKWAAWFFGLICHLSLPLNALQIL